LQHIPFDALPTTYRDAIVFTRGLGMQWLWIDSLCIIQDDLTDWQHEASKMSEVSHLPVDKVACPDQSWLGVW
jgi:hypothetical protein